ncbi:hypothetical protein KDM87_01040 [Undibacterium sp. FT147W]|uniref:Uncharacterized protein n=1 Tax=Undibacterium rivi TaxID=2828729 RepID=A0ABS5GYD0_9BURK|nr:hypothetical protein [Undibacterium rivi]MBR7791164.1 hypothetical protein [Undibacterium rivi]
MSGFALSPQTDLREPIVNLLSRIALFRVVFTSEARRHDITPGAGRNDVSANVSANVLVIAHRPLRGQNNNR